MKKKNKNGELQNIFLNDKTSFNESQSIIAKYGKFEKRGERKILVLYEGKIINTINGEVFYWNYTKPYV